LDDTKKGVFPTLAKRLSEPSRIVDLDKQRSTTLVGYLLQTVASGADANVEDRSHPTRHR
jgi:hypothetical protein